MKISTQAGAARFLVGRMIVAVDLRPFDTGRYQKGEVSFNPLITLDDGSQLTFSVSETEGSEYGVKIIRSPRAARGEP